MKQNSKHFYLKNRQGLYPNYPNPDTKKLLITEAIIDTASLLQIDQIKDNYTLLTAYGTNGLNQEILNAIKPLKELEEIIFFFDGDKAGNEAVAKYTEILRELHPKAKISQVEKRVLLVKMPHPEDGRDLGLPLTASASDMMQREEQTAVGLQADVDRNLSAT